MDPTIRPEGKIYSSKTKSNGRGKSYLKIQTISTCVKYLCIFFKDIKGNKRS